MPTASALNPLLARWEGPYGGVPPFDHVQVAQFAPALEASMAEMRAELARISSDPQPASFDNTSVAFESAGESFERVMTLFGVWSSNLSTPEFQKLELEVAPKLAAFSDEITQNEALFHRIEAVYQAREQSELTPEQQRLVWHQYNEFVLAGAQLDATAKQRLAAINEELVTLYTNFSQNLLAEEESHVTLLDPEAQLAGLPESLRASAAAAAEAHQQPGKWAITNTRSSVEPFLTFAQDRKLREQVWLKFVNRGDNGDAHDNNALITKVLRLRAERAKLLGYATHAHWRLQDSMAKTPEATLQLMETVWKPAVARVQQEVADMQKLTKQPIEPWDYRFYAEKVRKEKYDLDENELSPYLQLEKLREGMFWAAGQLFGFQFVRVEGLPVFHPDVSTWEVKDASGGHVGLWYFDPYARAGKQSGAWMSAYRSQESYHGAVSTIVSNNANFVKPQPGAATLVSWDDAVTLFHEFGHALHGLSSKVTYPSLSGTEVARDYVEFPSQLYEHWLLTPEVLNRFALHVETGEPIPAALVAKIEKAQTFNQGFKTIEYLSAALIDMKLHLAGDVAIDPDTFERDTLKALGMPPQVVMRHRTPQFAHVFAGDGYSAGYYSYLWSDTLTADAYEAFTEASGPYDRGVAERLSKNVFSVGNTVDPAEGYRAFRGKDPGIEALMRKRGFAPKR
ncbi:MAG TPA: M3 family metallopeptidase [Polyangiales bacterium]|nr:M3 family metallopeptidase [Polyangiales bacterium]